MWVTVRKAWKEWSEEKQALSVSLPFLLLSLALFLLGLNAAFPNLGADLHEYVPFLLGGQWHFIRQGIHPFLYDPHLCGGLPMFGNPEDMYYSLQQILTLVLGYLPAIQITAIVLLFIGYAGWWRFGRDVMRISPAFAHLFSLVVSACGFYFLHIIAGHLPFLPFPIMGWMLWLLLSREIHSLSIRALSFGFLVAAILFAGGYLILWEGIIAFGIFAVLDVLLASAPWARAQTLLKNVLAGGAVAGALCASKLVAIWSFMRFFPREVGFFSFDPNASTLAYMAKAFWAVPQDFRLFENLKISPLLDTPELSFFLSPVTLVGIGAGLALAWKRRRTLAGHPVRMMLIALFSIAILTFFVQLTRGYGPLASFLQTLPLFRSWRVPQRFLYILALSVCAVSIWSLERATEAWHLRRWKLLILSGGALLTLAGVLAAYGPLLRTEHVQELNLTFPYDRAQEAMRDAGEYLRQPVKTVMDYRGKRVTDMEYILNGATGMSCYQQLLTGDVPSWRSGPTADIVEEKFNMPAPACLQYPLENGCDEPQDRIRLSDRENFERYVNGEATTWKVSVLQKWADRVTLISLAACLSVCAYWIVLRLLRKRRKHFRREVP